MRPETSTPQLTFKCVRVHGAAKQEHTPFFRFLSNANRWHGRHARAVASSQVPFMHTFPVGSFRVMQGRRQWQDSPAEREARLQAQAAGSRRRRRQVEASFRRCRCSSQPHGHMWGTRTRTETTDTQMKHSPCFDCLRQTSATLQSVCSFAH